MKKTKRIQKIGQPASPHDLRVVASIILGDAGALERAHTVQGRWPKKLDPDDKRAQVEVLMRQQLALKLQALSEALDRTPIDALKTSVHALKDVLLDAADSVEGLPLDIQHIVDEAKTLVGGERPQSSRSPQLWIVHHQHRHGDSIWPVLSVRKPTISQIDSGDFELDREDEGLAIEGPFPLAKIDVIRPRAKEKK